MTFVSRGILLLLVLGNSLGLPYNYFDTFAGIMIDERKDLKRYLAERKEDVTEEALQLMEDLVTHLLKKQKDFTEKFEALHESKVKVITDQIKRCSMIQKETSTSMRQLTVS